MWFYEVVFGLSVIWLLVSVSPRAKYCARWIALIVIVSLTCALLIPVAFIRRNNPISFVYGAHIVNMCRRASGITWEVRGTENIKDKAYIIVSNHQSGIDVLGMLWIWAKLYPVVPVMKEELKFVGPFGLFNYLAGTVFVNRGSEKGRKALKEGLEAAKKEKKSLWIFPEGTRNRTEHKLLPFKKGAFHMALQGKMPILPVIFSSYDSFYDTDNHRFDSGNASITVLPEISTEGMSIDQVDELTRKVYNIMLESIQDDSVFRSKTE